MKALVQLEQVCLAYRGKQGRILAVDKTSLTIARGEFVAIVGPSGCGKSSLLKLIAGLIPATDGTITVAGERVMKPIKIVGMAFQNPTLLPWRTTLDNILLPLEIVAPHNERFAHERPKYVESALNLLDRVGLRGFEKSFPWELSGGMQQRASLCRALIHAPDLLLLDEPFGALDAFTREELWAVLQNLWLENPFTVLLVTHDLREALYLSDKVFVMSARPGRIISEQVIDFSRPRSLKDTFSKKFVDTISTLREEISTARGEVEA